MNKKTHVIISAMFLKLQLKKAKILEQLLGDDSISEGEQRQLIIDRECVSAKMEVLEDLERELSTKNKKYVQDC